MEGSVPQYSVLARRQLDQATAALADLDPTSRVQATATVGLGYAVLAVVQEMSARR
jgi:hypothetical protein